MKGKVTLEFDDSDLFSLFGPFGRFGGRVINSFVAAMYWLSKIKFTNCSAREISHYSSVSKLISNLRRQRKGETICAEGFFYPGVLLAEGWWKRENQQQTSGTLNFARGLDPIHSWLNYGFEQWAPSWECSLKTSDISDNILLGQLGCGDEAESILVVIPVDKAQDIRAEFLKDGNVIMARSAEVTGVLQGVSEIDSSIAGVLNSRLPAGWKKVFPHCLVVTSGDRQHKVTFQKMDKNSIYSGYIWQCLSPNRGANGNRDPLLDNAYFLWEHTNFTSKDTILFGIDALQSKRKLLEKRIGSCKLLQRSAWVIEDRIDEKPYYNIQDFRKIVKTVMAGAIVDR